MKFPNKFIQMEKSYQKVNFKRQLIIHKSLDPKKMRNYWAELLLKNQLKSNTKKTKIK